jgi:hypothetical protein
LFYFHLVGVFSQKLILPVLLALTGWLIWGAKVISHRQMELPLPAEDRIDVRGALRVLWWMIWWPRYL